MTKILLDVMDIARYYECLGLANEGGVWISKEMIVTTK
jgi:hypothetical protein